MNFMPWVREGCKKPTARKRCRGYTPQGPQGRKNVAQGVSPGIEDAPPRHWSPSLADAGEGVRGRGSTRQPAAHARRLPA